MVRYGEGWWVMVVTYGLRNGECSWWCDGDMSILRDDTMNGVQ